VPDPLKKRCGFRGCYKTTRELGCGLCQSCLAEGLGVASQFVDHTCAAAAAVEPGYRAMPLQPGATAGLLRRQVQLGGGVTVSAERH
jgi:hypothetical protein